MDTSFYTAARGARTQQDKMNVISNNMANVNTNGYKSKASVFQDLMYYNMRAGDADLTRLTAGTGVMQQRTNISFAESGYDATGGRFDFAITGDGFFQLRDPATNAISYTRNGHFSLSQRADGFYLVSDANKLVLDGTGNPIRVVDGELQSEFGIYRFIHMNGMESSGNNEFTPVAKNGNPIRVQEPKIVNGHLERSNVDLALEMANTIESSRAYSYALKMVQTSDEVEQTINSLRA